MDQSLARGLKNQLFREVGEKLDAVIADFLKITGDSRLYAKRANWDGYVGRLEKSLGRFSICSHSGGGKRKPYHVFMTLEDNSSRTFNSWNEKCFQSVAVFLSHDPWAVRSINIGFNISEHAIQRIYQRSISSAQLEGGGNDAYIVLDELKQTPVWVSYWMFFGAQLFKRFPVGEFSPIIPSINGLFLGKMRRGQENRIEIRTFVDDSLLDPVQLYLKNEMLALGSEFLKTSMGLLAALVIVGKREPLDIFAEFHRRVVPLFGILGAQVSLPDDLRNSMISFFDQ